MKLKKLFYCFTASTVVSALLIMPVNAANNEPVTIQPATAKHTQPPNSQVVIPFVVTKGKSYTLCNDVAAYINEHRAFYDSKPRELFSIKTGKFNKPKMKPSTFERYVRLELQNIGFRRPITLTGHNSWKTEIESIEKIMLKDLIVTEFTMDINNDGVRDNVFTYSFYEKKLQSFVFINYVINDEGNLNLAFKNGLSSIGELFYYDGRSFRYEDDPVDHSVHIYENFPMYETGKPYTPEYMTGLRNYPHVCAISAQK